MHRGAKMQFDLEWGGSWDRASAERSAIAACQRRTRRGRDGRGRSRLRCHRHLFADFFLTGFQGQLLKVLPRVSFPWALAFTACKNFVYGKRFCVCVEVKKSIWENCRPFFSRRQNTPLITLITVRHTGPYEAFFVACNSVPKSTILLT